MVSDSRVTKMWDEACQKTAFVFLLATHFFPTNKIKSVVSPGPPREPVTRRGGMRPPDGPGDRQITGSLMNGARRQNRKQPRGPGLQAATGPVRPARSRPAPTPAPPSCRPGVTLLLSPSPAREPVPPTGLAGPLIFTH